MKYIVIAFVVGLAVGILISYLWKRGQIIGNLRLQDTDQTTVIFLELEKELDDLKNRKTVTLRVNKSPYYEN